MLLTMESKTAAAPKLEELITRGRTKAGEVVDYIMNHQPLDRSVASIVDFFVWTVLAFSAP